MVDRYLLPVPKRINHRMYVRFKDKRTPGLLFLSGSLMICFQMARISFLKMQSIKPRGYYMDWGNKDAPKKVRYFS